MWGPRTSLQSLIYSIKLILFSKEKEFVVESFYQFHLLKRTRWEAHLASPRTCKSRFMLKWNHVVRMYILLAYLLRELKILFYILHAYLKNFNDLHFVLWLSPPLSPCCRLCDNSSFWEKCVYRILHSDCWVLTAKSQILNPFKMRLSLHYDAKTIKWHAFLCVILKAWFVVLSVGNVRWGFYLSRIS